MYLRRNDVSYHSIGLSESSIPVIRDTIPSPLTYGYRTKLTPHFDAPPKEHRLKKAVVNDGVVEKPEWLRIGFNAAGTHRVMDIEVSTEFQF
jgi:tRNA (uracil-5-)-methyltransferase